MHGDGLVLLRTIRLVGKRKQKQSRTIGRSMPAFFRFSFSSLWWSSSALRCNASRSSFLSISLMFALNTFCAAIVSSLVACSRARRRLTRSSSLSPKSRMGSPRRRRRLMTSLDEISPAWPSFSAWVALVSSLETIRGAADTLEATLSVEATASSSASEEEVDPSAAAWGTAATDTGAAAAFFACSTPHPHRVCQSAPRHDPATAYQLLLLLLALLLQVLCLPDRLHLRSFDVLALSSQLAHGLALGLHFGLVCERCASVCA